MIDFMNRENESLYWEFEFTNRKLRFFKDRDLRKLRKLIRKRYEYRNYFMPDLDARIELLKAKIIDDKRRRKNVKDYIEALREIKKEKGVFEITLSRKEVLELINEIDRLNNIINESAKDILKELEENHHLSYGVALAIRQKLLDYKEVKGDSSNGNK